MYIVSGVLSHPVVYRTWRPLSYFPRMSKITVNTVPSTGPSKAYKPNSNSERQDRLTFRELRRVSIQYRRPFVYNRSILYRSQNNLLRYSHVDAKRERERTQRGWRGGGEGGGRGEGYAFRRLISVVVTTSLSWYHADRVRAHRTWIQVFRKRLIQCSTMDVFTFRILVSLLFGVCGFGAACGRRHTPLIGEEFGKRSQAAGKILRMKKKFKKNKFVCV